mgnify:CR=1 FL=1
MVSTVPMGTAAQGVPFHGHTFRRNHEGDYRCSDDEVRRMMSDVVIERYPDRHVFMNPGTMLVSVEDFFKGGNTEDLLFGIDNIRIQKIQ